MSSCWFILKRLLNLSKWCHKKTCMLINTAPYYEHHLHTGKTTAIMKLHHDWWDKNDTWLLRYNQTSKLSHWNMRFLHESEVHYLMANLLLDPIFISCKLLTHWPAGDLNLLWPSDAIWQQRSGSTLAPDGTKPLPEPMLTNHQRVLVAFPWGQLHRGCSRYLSWYAFENYWFEITATTPRDQWVNKILCK